MSNYLRSFGFGATFACVILLMQNCSKKDVSISEIHSQHVASLTDSTDQSSQSAPGLIQPSNPDDDGEMISEPLEIPAGGGLGAVEEILGNCPSASLADPESWKCNIYQSSTDYSKIDPIFLAGSYRFLLYFAAFGGEAGALAENQMANKSLSDISPSGVDLSKTNFLQGYTLLDDSGLLGKHFYAVIEIKDEHGMTVKKYLKQVLVAP